MLRLPASASLALHSTDATSAWPPQQHLYRRSGPGLFFSRMSGKVMVRVPLIYVRFRKEPGSNVEPIFPTTTCTAVPPQHGPVARAIRNASDESIGRANDKRSWRVCTLVRALWRWVYLLSVWVPQESRTETTSRARKQPSSREDMHAAPNSKVLRSICGPFSD